MHLSKELSYGVRSRVGRIPIAVGRRVATCAVCCGLEAVRGQLRKLLFKMNRRVPNGRESTARLDNESCVCGVAVIEHFVFSCAAADSTFIR